MFLPTKSISHLTDRLDPAQLPEGALYQKITIDGDKIHTDTFYPMEDKPKQETTSLSGETKTKIIQKAPTYEGIGPRDRDSGMPLGLRQVCLDPLMVLDRVILHLVKGQLLACV